MEWQTKALAKFIAGTVPIDKGKKNPLSEAADQLRLSFHGDAEDDSDDVPMEQYIEHGSAKAENPAGSFEALMKGFSGG